MLKLITGQPGHGKTAYGIWLALKLKAEGRAVYAHGIKDLDYDRIGFNRIDDPVKWQDLPDGSVVVLDECYTTFPNRNPGSKVPEHVEAMARHRHRGFDFILIAQQGLQLDPFLRGLYEEHIHVVKKFGKATKLKRWSSYQGNIKAVCSDASDWIRPNEVFQYYTSTVLNTSKLHIPKWLQWIGILLVVMLLIGLYLKHSYSKKLEELSAKPNAQASAAADTRLRGGAAADAISYDTPADYAKAHLPRFPTMPWTAPVYDQRAVTADPQLLCMSSEAGADVDGNYRDASCTCMTEQGTKYTINEGECMRIARDGPVYNPYRTASQTQPNAVQQPSAGQGATPSAEPATAQNAGAMIAGAVLPPTVAAASSSQ
jgi:zona occludens toxin